MKVKVKDKGKDKGRVVMLDLLEIVCCVSMGVGEMSKFGPEFPDRAGVREKIFREHYLRILRCNVSIVILMMTCSFAIMEE